ncbi:MAG TPA: anti-sigma factor [Candidatus Lustribacter sp.]|nr:anti-sigma factor [Candidatus Lustribacter sp.]
MNDTPDRQELLDLVAAYALGVLPATQCSLVAAFILSDAEARREYDELRATANLVGLSAEEPVDSARAARMKERLMAAVRSDAAPRRVPVSATRSSAMWGTTLAAAAAVVFALVSVIQNFGLRSDLSDAQGRVATLQTRIDAEQRTVARDRRMLTDLAAGDAKRYPVAFGTVVTRGAHVYLALSSLPPLPRGRVYQAWTLARGAKAVAPSVTFSPSQEGLTLVPLPEDAGNLAAVAVSVEPEGGSRQPTTKPAFVQPLS